jgi:hypothetical protein
MKNVEIIKSLSLFNEKAAKLARLSFTKEIFKHNSGVTIKINRRNDGFYELTQERRGPLEEAIDAFVLTIRFFIQDNENVSLRNIARIYEVAPIEEQLKEKFTLLRNQLNQYLDSDSFILINVNGVIFNHRKILDVVIYGSLSHAKELKKKQYDFLMKSPLKALIENDFVYTLTIIFNIINSISELNKKVLTNLNQQKRGDK